MPKAIAPNAPWVDVWLSPHAIVSPGCVRPSSGPMTWTIPWTPLFRSKNVIPCCAAALLEPRRHLLGHRVGKRPRLSLGRDDVVHGGERALRGPHRPAARGELGERLRARDFVDEMEPDVELGLAIRQPANRVEIPNLLKQRLWHG